MRQLVWREKKKNRMWAFEALLDEGFSHTP